MKKSDVFIATAIGAATTLLIAYLTVEPPTGIFILCAGLSAAIVAALLLINIIFAIPLLIFFAPIAYVFWFKLTINTGEQWMFSANFVIIEVVTIVIFPCLLLYNSIVKGKQVIYGKKIYIGNLNILLLILIGWIFLSILWSPSTSCSIYSLVLFLIHLLIYLMLITLLKTEQELNIALMSFFATSVVIAVTMLISVLPIPSLNIEEFYTLNKWLDLKAIFSGNTMRAAGLTDEKHGSEYIAISIIGSMFFWRHIKDKKRKLLLGCSLVLFGFAFLFAQSKSAGAGLLAGILILSIATKKNRARFIRNSFRFVTIFILIFGIFLISQSSLLSHRGINKEQMLPTIYASSSQFQDATHTRLKWWNTCYKEIVRNNAYLYGLGIGGCGYAINRSELQHVVTVANPHSVYLSIFFDLGIIGVSLFLLLVLLSTIKIFCLIRLLNDSNEKEMLLALLCSAVIIGVLAITEVSYYQNVSIWVLFGVGVSAFRLIDSQQNKTIRHNKIQLRKNYNNLALK